VTSAPVIPPPLGLLVGLGLRRFERKPETRVLEGEQPQDMKRTSSWLKILTSFAQISLVSSVFLALSRLCSASMENKEEKPYGCESNHAVWTYFFIYSMRVDFCNFIAWIGEFVKEGEVNRTIIRWARNGCRLTYSYNVFRPGASALSISDMPASRKLE
jgi:hypothetical protein